MSRLSIEATAPTLTSATLIAGSGPCARQTASELAAMDVPLIIVTEGSTVAGLADQGDQAPLEILTHTTIQGCRQTEHAFHIDLSSGNHKFSRTVASIVVARGEHRCSNASLYGLQLSTGVVALSRVVKNPEALMDALTPTTKTASIVFLTGLFTEGNPVVSAEVMHAAHKIQSASPSVGRPVQTYILTKNLKVADRHLEVLYRETKQAGTVYVKFTDASPVITQTGGSVYITFTDEVTGLPFRLRPDITVVDETVLPPENIDRLAAALELDQDAGGFSQADNVHRLPVFTNRNGIFVGGPSRDIQSAETQHGDAANAALAAFGYLDTAIPPAKEIAVIDNGVCVRCLTCHRVCPHRAVSLDVHPAIMPKACESCGICAAECPAHAITIPEIEAPGLERCVLTERSGHRKTNLYAETFAPFIVAFCCCRGPERAAGLAALMGRDLPQGLRIVAVPCAGAVSSEAIFTRFQQGADGVLVLTCHVGNCHAQHGNIFTRDRVRLIRKKLKAMGFDAGRLEIQALAAVMDAEFSDLTRRFAQKVSELGPNPLRR